LRPCALAVDQLCFGLSMTTRDFERPTMEMHQIRYFLAVCETLNFTKAAELCHVTQPSLTRAIQKLEEELEGPLFQRERRLTQLTPLGRLMQPYLEQIYNGTEEAKARILHAAVGGINESDVTLASATEAIIIGFNVRANPQARDLARREGIDIRYYSIIYNVVDDIKAVLSGLLAPQQREKFLGYAEIREVFNITKVGKVAGCMVTEGQVKRGAKVRLLRDDVVIHSGALKTLRRFKDEVREVKDGYECGMAFENYQDIQVGDRIECYEVEEVARVL